MTIYEFDYLYDKLIKAQPRIYKRDERKARVKRSVHDLTKAEFEEQVNKIVSKPETKDSIEQLVKNHKFMKRRIQETREIIHEYETHDKSKEAGLDNYLNSVGATSAVDAISKRPKGQEEGS